MYDIVGQISDKVLVKHPFPIKNSMIMPTIHISSILEIQRSRQSTHSQDKMSCSSKINCSSTVEQENASS